MQLMTLNIWGGHIRNPLLDFIKSHQNIDIFCFQEVYHRADHRISIEDRQVSLNIFSDLQLLLPEHHGYFRPVVDSIYGISTFVKNSVEVIQEGEVTIYENPQYQGRGPTHSRILQWLEFRADHKEFSVINIHGLWNGKGKTDSPERLLQSKRIRSFMDSVKTPKIVCGDFNLRPDIASMAIIEEGMNNHIKTHNIRSTRTSLYEKDEKYADYILTSPEIIVHKFELLKDEVSDHSPLLLEFS